MYFEFFPVLILLMLQSSDITAVEKFPSQDLIFRSFISDLISDFFANHRIFLTFGNFSEISWNRSRSDYFLWIDKFAEIVSNHEIIAKSGGVINTKIQPAQSKFITIERPSKSVSEVTQVVFLILPEGIPSDKHETAILQRLNLPLLNPPTVKNTDKYVIITKKSRLKTLSTCTFFIKLKYKLVLTEDHNGKLNLHHFCRHCPIQESVHGYPTHFSRVSEYFPDFQRNFYGYLLKATATDKMYGDLEFAKDPKTGKDYAKRGIFAIVLRHLSGALNFSSETFRSSGGGTGTQFPNGTWVGSVGDVYYGDATFCMLCSISLSRHKVIDMCSPVTYEYVKYAMGPRAKLYTWQAIFWPFSWDLWVAMMMTFVTIIFCSYLFLKYNVEENQSSWDITAAVQFFPKVFIEQADVLPVDIPQTIKIIMGYWLLFTLIGTTLYRAKMVTFMTFPVFESAPQTFDELVKSEYKIVFHYFPNIAYNSFRLSSNPVMQQTFQKLIKEPDPVLCMKYALTTKSVCIMFTSVHEDTINRNMSDRFGQSPIKAAPGYAYLFSPGIVLEKMADVYSNFKWILSNSLQMGLNEHWQRSDQFKLLEHKNMWVNSIPKGGDRSNVFQYDYGLSDDVLHLKHFKGAYVVFFAGLILSSIAFLGEQVKSALASIFYKKEIKQVKVNPDDFNIGSN